MNCAAVVVAAGSGARLGMDTPKCLVRVDSVPLLAMAAFPFEQVPEIAETVLVVPAGYEDEARSSTAQFNLAKVRAMVAGGERRQDSVAAGVAAVGKGVDFVLVHDGARALLPVRLIRRLIEALPSHPAVLPALPVGDTLHESDGRHALPGPDRTRLVAAQTPQGFNLGLLRDALERAALSAVTATDEVSLVRDTMGTAAFIVAGDPANIKITRPEDLSFYSLQLKARCKQMKESGG